MLWKMNHVQTTHIFEEHDKLDRLHVHGICEIPTSQNRKLLIPKGYTIKFTPIVSDSQLRGWIQYCNKEDHIGYTNYDIPYQMKHCCGDENKIYLHRL